MWKNWSLELTVERPTPSKGKNQKRHLLWTLTWTSNRTKNRKQISYHYLESDKQIKTNSSYIERLRTIKEKKTSLLTDMLVSTDNNLEESLIKLLTCRTAASKKASSNTSDIFMFTFGLIPLSLQQWVKYDHGCHTRMTWALNNPRELIADSNISMK